MTGFVPGALAVIVGPACPDNGKIVELVKLAVLGDTIDSTSKRFYAGSAKPCWVVKSLGGPIMAQTGGKIATNMISVVEKYRLKIIGDPAGRDETLDWANLPLPEIKMATCKVI